MARTKVDPRATETEAEAALADDIADNGPSVESVADGGRVNDQFGSEPYNPARSIDANPDHRSKP